MEIPAHRHANCLNPFVAIVSPHQGGGFRNRAELVALKGYCPPPPQGGGIMIPGDMRERDAVPTVDLSALPGFPAQEVGL